MPAKGTKCSHLKAYYKKIYQPGEQVGYCIYVREVSEIRRPHTKRMCVFKCECGKEFEGDVKSVRKGVRRFCEKCSRQHRIDLYSKPNRNTKEYGIWNGMRQRCSNPNNEKYPIYGGRGIKVCERWDKSFDDFLEDMGKCPPDKYSIDRHPNNDGNYEPGNCRWATPKEQSRNQSTNRKIIYNGEEKCLIEWAEIYGLSQTTIANRIDKFGWTLEEAFTIRPYYGKNKRNKNEAINNTNSVSNNS